MANQIGYKGQVITLEEDPRCGVCNHCRAVSGEIDAQRDRFYRRAFHMHHEKYDDSNPIAHTTETCPSCHRKLDGHKRALNRPPRRKVVFLTERTYRELSRLGDLTEDHEIVMKRLLDFWDATKGNDPLG